jgi:hypothetical protein
MSLTTVQRGQAERLLAGLDREGLLELRAMIDDALEALETAEEPRHEHTGNGNGASSKARGWVELKTIKGYGPYAYRRWRDGGRLRSEYIGKVKE